MLHTLDVKKLLCPLPVIRLQEVMEEIAVADQIEILATDPGVIYDIPTWCRIHGHTVMSTENSQGIIRMIVLKN